MSEVEPIVADPIAEQRDAFMARLGEAGMGMWELATIYIGDRLGFYEALAASDTSTSAELAARTGTHERYVREWLEQQTVARIVAVDDASAAPTLRRYSLPGAYHDVLVNRASEHYLAPSVRVGLSVLRPLPALLEAFRTGGGIPFDAYGDDLREGMGDSGRPLAEQLVPGWIATLPELHTRLGSDPPARVAEIGCGSGWDSIGIAHAYPSVRVDGFDLDAPSVALAQANAVVAGVADRVTFQARDSSKPALTGTYDLVLAIITVHDTPRPVEVLSTMRRLAGTQGTVIVADPKVGNTLADDLGEENDVARNWYAASVLHCLPIGMVEQPSAATGTIMRPDTLRRYARDAGFEDIEILPIENDLLQVYRLFG